MRIGLTAAIIFLAFSSTSYAQSLEVGDYIVVRGAIAGCEEWKSRILDVTRVEGEGPIEVLGLPAIEVLGMTSIQIHKQILRKISAATGRTPTSLRVEILSNSSDYRLIIGEYGASLNALIKNDCPFKGKKRPIRPMEPIEPNVPLEIAEKLVLADEDEQLSEASKPRTCHLFEQLWRGLVEVAA